MITPMAVLLAAAVQAEPPEVEWQQVTAQAEFSIRDTAEDFVHDGKMWLSNGYYNGNVLSRDLWNSADGKTWTLVRDDTPYDGYSEMAVYDGKIWAVKGSVWNSTDGREWTQVLEQTPFGVRGYGELVVHQGKLFQLGSGRDVWSTTDGVEWTQVTSDAPFGRRYGSAVATFGGKLWLMGGAMSFQSDPPEQGYAAYTTFNDVWCSEDGATWIRVLEHAPWPVRMWTVAREYAGRLWLIGGYANRVKDNLGDIWCTTDGRDWANVPPPADYLSRHEPTIYVFDNSFWIVAGNHWPLLNDVWRFTTPQP